MRELLNGIRSQALSSCALAVVVLLLISFCLVSCGTSSSPTNVLNLRFSHDQSEEQLRQALASAEKTSNPDDRSVLPSLEALADYYLFNSQPKKAQPLFERAIAIRKLDSSSDRALSLAGLAQCLPDGDYDQAEKLFLQAVAIEEANQDNDKARWTLTSLAQFYKRNNRIDKTAQIHRKLLTMAERAGESLITDMFALAEDEEQLKEIGKAEQHYKQALSECRQLHGSDYTETIYYVDALAEFYVRQKKYPQAEELFKQCLAEVNADNAAVERYDYRSLRTASTLREPVLGYASLLHATGRDKEIEKIFQQYTDLVEKRSPADLATAVGALADKEHDLKRYDRANVLLQRQLDLNDKLSGENKVDSADLLEKMAANAVMLKQSAKADTLFARMRELKVKDDPESADEGAFLLNRALVFRDNDDHVVARYLFGRAIKLAERRHGPRSVEVADALHGFAHSCESAGQKSEAEQLYSRSLAIYQAVAPSKTSDIVDLQRDLAELLCDEKKYPQSGKLFQVVIGQYRQRKLPEDFDVEELLHHYATFLRATNHVQEAKAVEAEARSL